MQSYPTHYGAREIRYGIEADHLVRDCLASPEPCLIARFGAVELQIVHYYHTRRGQSQIDFPESLREVICSNAGVFPPTSPVLSRFSQDFIRLLPRVDAMAVWNFQDAKEQELLDAFAPQAALVGLSVLGGSPSFSWVQHLKDKKILVIHPFAKTILKQYPKREAIYPRHPLPAFELKVINAVQGLNPDTRALYPSWFDALREMRDKIDREDFDIALIGAGAFGIFLADHVKKIGKKAVHMGGALQILFGIRGSRWDKYNLYNAHWAYPAPDETLPDLTLFLKHEANKAYW